MPTCQVPRQVYSAACASSDAGPYRSHVVSGVGEGSICHSLCKGCAGWLQVISGYRKASALLKDMTVKDPHGVWNSLFLEVTAMCMRALPIH